MRHNRPHSTLFVHTSNPYHINTTWVSDQVCPLLLLPYISRAEEFHPFLQRNLISATNWTHLKQPCRMSAYVYILLHLHSCTHTCFYAYMCIYPQFDIFSNTLKWEWMQLALASIFIKKSNNLNCCSSFSAPPSLSLMITDASQWQIAFVSTVKSNEGTHTHT